VIFLYINFSFKKTVRCFVYCRWKGGILPRFPKLFIFPGPFFSDLKIFLRKKFKSFEKRGKIPPFHPLVTKQQTIPSIDLPIPNVKSCDTKEFLITLGPGATYNAPLLAPFLALIFFKDLLTFCDCYAEVFIVKV
jgi:hypothetical protein